MITATLPLNENLRLLDLASYEIMDTHAENDFDELVELASQICKCPISLITLLDEDRQWFKAKKGLEASSTSKDVAFCAHAILQDEVMIINNALEDERFADNPLVTGDLNIRFYAGAPIMSPGGHKLGTLCIIDHKPKTLTSDEKRMLALLSRQVTKLLELRKKNALIRQRAAEIIGIKSKAIGTMIQSKEDDKKNIADSLHEDLAQTVAACKMHLKLAVDNKEERIDIIQDVREQLDEVLTKMRNLSYKIMPPALQWIPAGKLIQEFVENIAITFSFNITFINKSNEDNQAPVNTLIAIRIIEQWLKVLDNKGVSEVYISILINDQFELTIEENNTNSTAEEMHEAIFKTLIHDRVHAGGGTVTLSELHTGKILQINLPIEEK